MSSLTFGYVYIFVILILLVIAIILILDDKVDLFIGDREHYLPPRYVDLCSSNLYGSGSNTQPTLDKKIYWNADKLLKISKNINGGKQYSRSCDNPPCTLTSKIGNRLIVYDENTKTLSNSYDNELRAFAYNPSDKYYLYNQPLKYGNITDRNPFTFGYSNSSQSKYFDVGTGSKGYITTEEECLNSCKDDCLGYFMIPNQFKGGQPYCLQLGVNSHAIKDNKIDLHYSCSCWGDSTHLKLYIPKFFTASNCPNVGVPVYPSL